MDKWQVGDNEEFYSSDRFMMLNRSIEQDSPWKVEQLTPLLRTYCALERKQHIRLLDVGGGSGLVMKGVAEVLERESSKTIQQYAIDLSPGYLALQMRNNPAIIRHYESSIASTPFADKEIDLLLLIDVLEHLQDLRSSYREMRRIARYVLLKVPLESNLSVFLLDLFTGYRKRRAGTDGVGHIHFYSARSLRRELCRNLGKVAEARYTDVFSYLLTSPQRRTGLGTLTRWYCHAARFCHTFSPSITALLFNDFMVLLVECD